MDKSVISTFKENIELAASKYDSISLHLNALRQRVLGSRPSDVHKPVTAVTHSNDQEACKSETCDETPSFEDRNLDPETILSDNDLGYCDANSNVSEENTSSSQFTESSPRDEKKSSEKLTEIVYIQEHESVNNTLCESHEGNEMKTPELEDVENASISVGEKEDLNTSSSSSDLSLTDEENENIYSELLKRIEYEEEKRSVNYNPHSQKDKESDSESSGLDSVHDPGRISNQGITKDRDSVNINESFQPVKKSFSQRAKEIMESIEEDNEEWEALGQQLISRGLEEITYEKLFPLKEKNLEDISEGYSNLEKDKAVEEVQSINTKRTVSKVSSIECKKTDSHQTIHSKTISFDNMNSSCGQKFQKHNSVVFNRGKKELSKSEAQFNERLTKKSITNSSKFISKKVLKQEKVVKSKQMSTVHRIAGTKFSKNTKLKSNIKTITKNLPQKNSPAKLKTDQTVRKNTKINFLKPIHSTEKKESSFIIRKSVESMLSTEQIKKPIESLIKSKPDNIFLKKELNRISENTFSTEAGAGDGLDKVRSQAIISSMNQSINKLDKPYLPTHYIKNKKPDSGPPVSNQKLSNKLNEQNKMNTSNNNASKTNVVQKTDGPYMKKSAQICLKKLDTPLSNKSRTNINKVAGNKRTKSRRETTAADPKEILAQLEKEVSFPKCMDKYGIENEVKIEPLYSEVSLELPGTSRQRKIYTPKDIKSDLEHNKSNINRFENSNNKQKNGFTHSLQTEVPVKPAKHTAPKGDRDVKRKSHKVKSSNRLKIIDSKTEHHQAKKKENLKGETFSNGTISNIPNKIISLEFDGTKPKIISFPFILGQSTSKSYNIQANVQQTMSVMMMLPSESVRKTLSVETKISSKSSTQTALTINTTQVKCPACVIKNDQDYLNDNPMDDPWDTEYTRKNFVRCTCIPRNTVSFKTVMKQLLSDPTIGSFLPLSETSTLYEESIEKTNENKQLCRRSDLTKLLHATQRIRERLVT